MDNKTETQHTRIVALELEIKNLREGYIITNQRYMGALKLIREHAIHVEQAANRVKDRVTEVAKRVEDATALAAQTIEIAANLAQEKSKERACALLEAFELHPDIKIIKEHIAASVKDVLKAKTDAAVEVKLIADTAAKIVEATAVSAETEVAIENGSH